MRQSIPARPGKLERCDCEYKRNGTANLFVFLDVHRPWRKIKVTDSRTGVDFAVCMRDLTDVYFPKAKLIRVVLDNLSTQSAGTLSAFRQTKRAGFCADWSSTMSQARHWLNMVEIEIGVLRSQCLDRRIATKTQVESEIAAWERQRNAAAARIKWMFTTDKAHTKIGRAYPTPRQKCIARGMNANTFYQYISCSPIICRLAREVYALRPVEIRSV